MGTALVGGASVAPGFQEKRFQAGGVSIHYAEGPAAGPPLILLHGLSRDWKSFSVLLPELSSRYHLLALDLRGHGRSSRVSRGYRIAECAQDVSPFMKHVVPRGAAIFGYSLGGEVGMCVAADEDSQVSALIVGDPVISPENFARSMYDPLFLQLHEIILRGGSQEDLAHGIGKIEIHVPGSEEALRIEELPGNTRAVFLEWARCAMQTDPEALAMTLDGSAFLGWDPVQILPRISCPVLLLQGNPELDALLTDDDVKLALKLLHRGEHVKFPLLGHALFMQQAKPVLAEIIRFLSSGTRLDRMTGLNQIKGVTSKVPDINLWSSPEHALEYLGRADSIPHRAEGESALLEFLPRDVKRVLDVGSGAGRLLALVQAARPEAEFVAVDFSPIMLNALREQFGKDKSVAIVSHDLATSLPELGKFDAVVSCFAIHHLIHERKRELYKEVFELLISGGVFCNLEHVASATTRLHHQILATLDVTPEQEDPSNKLLDIETQLSWLREIGFEDVDCQWKWRELALMTGARR